MGRISITKTEMVIAPYTLLHNKEILSAILLLDKGANINLTDIYGNPPIWTAIFNAYGDYRLVKLYAIKGAKLDIENKHKMTSRKLAETIAGFDINSINQKEK